MMAGGPPKKSHWGKKAPTFDLSAFAATGNIQVKQTVSKTYAHSSQSIQSFIWILVCFSGEIFPYLQTL